MYQKAQLLSFGEEEVSKGSIFFFVGRKYLKAHVFIPWVGRRYLKARVFIFLCWEEVPIGSSL